MMKSLTGERPVFGGLRPLEASPDTKLRMRRALVKRSSAEACLYAPQAAAGGPKSVVPAAVDKPMPQPYLCPT